MSESTRFVFVTHAEVVIDPNTPVPEWGLSDVGRARHATFNDALAGMGVDRVVSSAERKAMDGAAIHGAALGLEPTVVDALHENDRSATGYLPPPEFWAVATEFFKNPETSVRGWERAVDAQSRIVDAIDAIGRSASAGETILVVSHGGVGALLMCRLKGAPISNDHGQPGGGGGNAFTFDWPTWSLIEGWRPIA